MEIMCKKSYYEDFGQFRLLLGSKRVTEVIWWWTKEFNEEYNYYGDVFHMKVGQNYACDQKLIEDSLVMQEK